MLFYFWIDLAFWIVLFYWDSTVFLSYILVLYVSGLISEISLRRFDSEPLILFALSPGFEPVGLLLIEFFDLFLGTAFWEAYSLVLMVETHDGSLDPRMEHGPARFQRRRNAKAYKILEGKLRYVVGQDIYIWIGWKL